MKLNKGRPPLQDALRSSTRKVLNFGTSVAKILDSVELDTDSEAEELDKVHSRPSLRFRARLLLVDTAAGRSVSLSGHEPRRHTSTKVASTRWMRTGTV